jgi:hypothetical protein
VNHDEVFTPRFELVVANARVTDCIGHDDATLGALASKEIANKFLPLGVSGVDLDGSLATV